MCASVVRVRACGERERDVRAGEGEKVGTGMRWGRGEEGGHWNEVGKGRGRSG